MVVNAYLVIYDTFSAQRHGREWTKFNCIILSTIQETDFEQKSDRYIHTHQLQQWILCFEYS